MSQKVVTLYIDDTSLKLLVAQGKGVKKWANLSLEPGLVSDGVINDPALLADKLKGLLHDNGVKTKKVIAGLSGLHCLSRIITLPNLPKATLAEAVNREAERLLPIALEELYISWQLIHDSRQEMKFFLLACPRNATDALIATLRQAGIKPDLIDLTPLALARVVDRATAIIADLRSNELDIVIMVGGVPELIRNLPLPVEAVSPQEKLLPVKEELERTIKYYNSTNPEKPLDSEVPIYVSGELGEEPKLCQSLKKGLGQPVLPLSPPLKCPETLKVNQYAVNIGLALKKLSPWQGAVFSVVNLDVTPEVYLTKPPSLAKILIVPSIILIIGLLLPLVKLVQDTAADTASLKAQVDSSNQLMKQSQMEQQSQKNQITELKEKIAQIELTNNSFTAVIDNFDVQQKMVNDDLELTTNNLPSFINLTTITQTDGILTISGLAPNETEVLSYARSLSDRGRFPDTIMEAEDEGMNFTLVFGNGECE